jgi:spermidine synthase
LKKNIERPVVAVVIATGIASVVTQLVAIREFLSQFQGNEIVIALILFCWLVLGGAGTLLSRPAAVRQRATWGALCGFALGLLFFSAVTILGARLLRDVFFLRGSSVGFYPTFLFILAITAPYALLVGFLLPFSLFVLRSQRPDYPGALVYIWDSIGDISGGAVFSFLLVWLLTPLQAISAAHLPLLVMILFLQPSSSRRRLRVYVAAAAVCGALSAALFLERATLSARYGELAYYQETRYGRLTVVQQDDQLTLFQDGNPTLTSQNEAAAEEAVHYALAQLDHPRRVLIFSANSDLMEELEKYRLESIDYVELDPELTEVLFRFNLMKRVPGLQVIHGDGRAFLSETATVYDAILVNLSDPETFQTNRYFTDRFFDLARAHLTDQGVLSFSMQGFQNYLADPHGRKLSSLYRTAKAYFPHVLMLPGQRVFFLCSARPLSADIPDALARKGISTAYLSAYYEGNVTPERISRLRGWMDPASPPNAELTPYVMRTVFWEWFAKFDSSPLGFIGGLAALLVLYFYRISRVEFVLFSTGWTAMGSEILIIFAFQIFFGYIYFKIGLIVTVFLSGLLPGAVWGRRLAHRPRRVLMLADAGILALLGVSFVLVHAGDRLPQAVYLLLGFMISLACGLQIPPALRMMKDRSAAVTGVFSADLIGAAFGTLVMSTIWIPYMGITGAIGGLILLKLVSLLMAGMLHEKPFAQTVSD